MFWWNPKPSKKFYSTLEQTQNFPSVYKMNNWKIKIELKEHLSF